MNSVTVNAGTVKFTGSGNSIVRGATVSTGAALDLTGGAGIVRRAEIERLFRDARVGRVQAGYARFTHDLVGRMLLGLPLDDATASRA